MNNKHIHAEAMKQYAEDAMETDKPWERWEWLDLYPNNGWCLCTDSPKWVNEVQYRRKNKHQEFLDAVATGRIDDWEVRNISWDNYNWTDEYIEERVDHIRNHQDKWETRRKQEPEEVLPPVGSPVWVRDDENSPWQIAMFSGKADSLWPYRVYFSDYKEEGYEGFKYMTTENPCR